MKILYVFSGIDQAGGVQKIQIDKANYFAAKKGFKVAILTTFCKAGAAPYFHVSREVSIFTASQLDCDKSGARSQIPHRLLAAYKFRRAAKMAINNFQPDIIIQAGGYETLFMIGLYGKSKFICEFHFSYGSEKFAPQRGVFQMALRKLLTHALNLIRTRADVFTVLTNEDLHSWKASGLKFRRITYIPNPAPTIPAKGEECEREKTIIAVGRLDFQKCFHDLIEIWAITEKEAPDWRLEIYGDGPEKNELIQKASSLGLARITFRGKTTKILEKMQQCKIFVMTSAFEGFPLAMLEAMACGLPCITFDFKCGPRDIIKNGINGFIVENRSHLEFAKKILELTRDEPLAKTLSTQAEISAKSFSTEVIMAMWENLYNEVAEKQ